MLHVVDLYGTYMTDLIGRSDNVTHPLYLLLSKNNVAHPHTHFKPNFGEIIVEMKKNNIVKDARIEEIVSTPVLT